MSACVGSAAAGARSFTATASQGLALMNEVVFIASSLRLPMVMTVANRSLSGPLSIWNDHSDVMSVRDCGWIQYFVENGQESFDHVLIGFRVSEDPRVSIPVMVNMDGFILTHMIEPHILLSQEDVDRYLPPFRPIHVLDPNHPLTMGDFAMPEIFTEIKASQQAALKDSRPVIDRAWKEFGELTGRHYQAVETYRAEDARVILVAMGAMAETAMVAVDRLREQGLSVGLVRLRLWRPFPAEDLLRAAGHAEKLVVMDRAISFGAASNPVATELAALFYSQERRPSIFNWVIGLAGRDVHIEQFEDMLRKALEADGRPGPLGAFEILGVRE
jgi:pyruvate ferredoxin oxidoreductase alpha subunit